jgi:nitrate reductase alpha subunit
VGHAGPGGQAAGFSPIPAMSMVSHAIGSRFIELIGGCMTSFYDWYADLPAASPQVFGDQTDVPESGDWWNAAYLIMWGSNVPVTRTPDAHWMAEARYRGQKVVVVSPDYADNTKFADTWLPAQPGTDGALAMAMGQAILGLLIMTGAMGRNGGGWAHYVGQEKCRPVTGWATLAMATDWQRPPRQAIGTGFWYLHTDQWRYDGY